MMKIRRLSMEKKRYFEAYVFMTPFIAGILLFFAFPLYISIRLSFGDIQSVTGFQIVLKDSKHLFDNYIRAFVVDTQFIPLFLQAVFQTLTRVPLVTVFALMLAILASRKIRFQGFFRTVFFIPFLLGTGNVLQQILNLGIDKMALSLETSYIIPQEVIHYLGSNVSAGINNFLGVIVQVLWNCGVQILLFMSGIQAIPSSLYESAGVDGATEWEKFWKITLPMITPVIVLNLIYSITDSFTNINNPLLKYIQQRAFGMGFEFEYSAAIGWIYLLFIMLLILVVLLILGRNGMSDVRESKR